MTSRICTNEPTVAKVAAKSHQPACSDLQLAERLAGDAYLHAPDAPAFRIRRVWGVLPYPVWHVRHCPVCGCRWRRCPYAQAARAWLTVGRVRGQAARHA